MCRADPTEGYVDQKNLPCSPPSHPVGLQKFITGDHVGPKIQGQSGYRCKVQTA